MKRELLADMREAYRMRDVICRKISIKKAIKSDQVRNTSHIMIKVGEITFYDLADIDMLKYSSNAKQISQDFSGMTNTILSLSQFYKDHEIHKSEKSYFHSILKEKIKQDSNILLVCCVTE